MPKDGRLEVYLVMHCVCVHACVRGTIGGIEYFTAPLIFWHPLQTHVHVEHAVACVHVHVAPTPRV